MIICTQAYDKYERIFWAMLRFEWMQFVSRNYFLGKESEQNER
jgi:hypothetical protein